MPFRYRLQKILEIRIRKRDEQIQVVIKAQEEVQRIELLIIQNLEQIQKLTAEMRKADPIMFDSYDKFIKHLWEEDKKLQIQKQEAIEALNREKEILKTKELLKDTLLYRAECVVFLLANALHFKNEYIDQTFKKMKRKEKDELLEILKNMK